VNNKEQVVVGIDVSKATLDVAVLPSGEVLHLSNDVNGIEALGEKLELAAAARAAGLRRACARRRASGRANRAPGWRAVGAR